MDKFSYKTMELVEDHILEQIGLFVNDVSGLPVFLMDQPWPAQIQPSIGLRVIDYRDSGGWGETPNLVGDYFQAELDLRVEVEFFARSGRPMANLAMLIQAFRGFKEERRERLYSKGIGFLSVGNAVPANTVFDGDETEMRARMTAVFNVRLKTSDIVPTTPIETITGSIFTNVLAAREEYGFNKLYEFYNGPHEGSEDAQERLKRGLRTAIFQKFQVDIITT